MPNLVCQVESLARRLPLRAGMRVLDLGCGKATSSIFLARELGIQVWAADGAISPTENHRRAIELQCEASVFPLRVDAHGLPFAKEFFDAVIAIDSFLYFGTEALVVRAQRPVVEATLGKDCPCRCAVRRALGRER